MTRTEKVRGLLEQLQEALEGSAFGPLNEITDEALSILDGCVIVPRDVRQWWAYPIEMPINAEGGGPAEIGGDAVGLRFEVWDRELNTLGDFEFLPDAINSAMIAASEEGE